ncbi:hypothetical protein MTo_02837 [Microcystis aeruginosa NIES-1211]|uniref:Uncharacterized protein n=1 Tax=Microcystis aeruginosa NIES-2519 TaxID=2303981 RepID=A0A5A5R4J1_MICAE|nr:MULTISPECIES: hypothetical protein [Microcystis]AVQ70825.1 hypothetical protein B5D77_05335 [Microcystis sp. MC19]GBL15523.1 hypothetical protein MTo_02837 [Microcystis aeruginosa NIES-1211]GCA69549.1 hypothetical protein MiYa_01076 [Microcystis aeruginosa NIES-2519]GCA85329.1 hypothetical protein MiHa_03310 [Microcystis aeruginosa NIES-2522]GCA89620.1 hypothetical protein MiTa_02971 [Microcystis aeruginosa NIES-4264]
MMQLEDYFNFLTPNDIRLKGTRIGIETILYDYIYKVSQTSKPTRKGLPTISHQRKSEKLQKSTIKAVRTGL